MKQRIIIRRFLMRWRRMLRHAINRSFRLIRIITGYKVKAPHLKLGISGEEIASNILTEIGIDVLERNMRNRYGEIDIIARENGMLCFIEVKTRHRQKIGRPADAVTIVRQKRYARAAALYMSDLTGGGTVPHRFDIIEVIYDDKCPTEMNYLRQAFVEPWKTRRFYSRDAFR